MPIHSRFQTTTLDLALTDYGGEGPPLLLLHGVLRCGADFAPVLPAVTASHRVLALDHRGHGNSRRAAGRYRVIDYAEDTVAWLRRWEGEPVVVYGHSLGAMVACFAAAHAPERVRALVLEDPPFAALGPAILGSAFEAQFRGMRDALAACDGTVPGLARDLAEIRVPAPSGEVIRLGDVRDGSQLRFGAKCLLQVDPAVFETLLAGQWLDGWDTDAILAAIRCPVLLLVGETARGGMLPEDAAASVASRLADCTRVHVPGAGHLLHWTHTAEVVRLVTAFLASL